MAHRITQITHADLEDLVHFYEHLFPDDASQRKESNELRWLLGGLNQPDPLNGFVARNEAGEVSGMIGFTLSEYSLGDRRVRGVIPMSWMVDPEERGFLGIQLLLKVMKLGEFGFAIHGSEDAMGTYSAVKLKPVCRAHVYRKITRPVAHALGGRWISPKNWFWSFYFASRRKSYNDNPGWKLEPSAAFLGDPGMHGQDLAIVPTPVRNAWFASCPLAVPLTYTLTFQDEAVGCCIAYMGREPFGKRKGKIVHIPYLGDASGDYKVILSLLEEQLENQGCASTSILANHPALRSAILELGFRTHDRSLGTQIFVRDPDQILADVDFSRWHLSYYESDKAYRLI